MITRTPPRDNNNNNNAMARKRNRPAASSAPTVTASFLSASGAGGNHHDPSLFQHGGHVACFSSPDAHDRTGGIAGAAAVSPFAERSNSSSFTARSNSGNAAASSLLFKLEPVSEETTHFNDNGNGNFNLSQDSIASSVTFASSNATGSHSAEMDFSCSGGEIHNNAMIGTMVGGTCESIVECSVGGSGSGSGPSSLSSDGYVNNTMGFDQFQEHQDCLPSSKRMRMMDHQYEPQVSQSVTGDDIMSENDFPPPSLAHNMSDGWDNKNCPMNTNTFGANNTMSLKTNIDKPQGRCCHVCSLEDSTNKNEDVNNAATAASNDIHHGHASDAPISSTAPRSHSLLSYFQPTKKKQSTPKTPVLKHNASSLQQKSNLHPCRYCDKPTCIGCTRQCEMCNHRFCTFCTKVDYESSITERILCFECDEYDAGRDNSGCDGDCDMMDL